MFSELLYTLSDGASVVYGRTAMDEGYGARTKEHEIKIKKTETTGMVFLR